MDSKSRIRDLRLEMRVKNNILWRAIHASHPTVAAFCKAYNLQQGEVGQLISFKASPFTKKNEYRVVAVRLSEVLGIAATELFPPKLYASILEGGFFKVVEVSSVAALPNAARKEMRLLPAPSEQNPDALCIKAELNEKMKTMLDTLSTQERDVIKLLYGIGGGRILKLKEVANKFGLTSTRIRQIEAEAVRKLQQPGHAKELVGFLD